MKKSYILIALAMVAALTMVSCKNNNNKSQNQEPTQEEVQAMKTAMADSVLAKIDQFAEEYFVFSDGCFRLPMFELTDAEKMVKPNYLLDPADVEKFVTKSQKTYALAIYSFELHVRRIYDMPTESTEEAIVKLAAQLNHPSDLTKDISNSIRSDRFRAEYEFCKENGLLAYFWQYKFAILIEMSCILAENPDLFFSKISEEGWQNYVKRITTALDAIRELAKYDSEMALIFDQLKKIRIYSSNEEIVAANATKELAKQFRIDHKARFLAARNALLQ